MTIAYCDTVFLSMTSTYAKFSIFATVFVHKTNHCKFVKFRVPNLLLSPTGNNDIFLEPAWCFTDDLCYYTR